MAKKSRKSASGGSTIVVNKKARHEYFLQASFEAGLVLSGWEVKSLRDGKVQLTDSYVLLKDGEAWLIGVNITPLPTVSTHIIADPRCDRKLLLNKRELGKLFGATQQQGQTCVCTKLYWKKHLIKAEIALAKGKKEFDKRASEKEREWNIEKQRVVRHNVR
ncbi:MAG: SsrA-binding protein SmpB [Endozoicomonadaceae bacterium]|nr:SsrA-binding protein SmpB [Endozoicomonadaceae bacterium]MCY4329389.1 SsrA-binding protein SmpB [Endozoicomonadaceae bacterium]